MRLIVFGSNGPTGRLLVADALAAGHSVTAFTRHPADFDSTDSSGSAPSPAAPEGSLGAAVTTGGADARLTVIEGDVYDAASVERAVAGHDAVISTLGVPFGKQPITVYSVGLTAIIRAMQAQHVSRLVCVSSSAVDLTVGAHGGFFFEKVLQPYFVNVMGKTLYTDMRAMEEIVRTSDVDWTIVRPSGLFETPGVTDYATAETFVKSKFTSRADLAACLLSQATSTEYIRKVVAVGTVSVQPSLVQLLWREGISKQRLRTT
ncbi:MAG: NAD-dependent epimerase [Subtercola sp.]|jgi:putative NADH-flavin reductase|nr:NAD-dependent epimerase [Subtercola sp.]